MNKTVGQMYQDWQNSETSSTFDLYCYEQGRADAINDVLKQGAHFWEIDGEFYIKVRDIYEMCISLAPQR